MNKTVRKILQRVRTEFAAHGYDIRPVDSQCWEDQQRLLSGASPAVIVDAGANQGGITRIYRALFPEARILCFEPIPDFFQMLAASFSGDPKVQSHQCALGEEIGTRDFYVNVSRDTSSLLQPDTANLNDGYSETMKVDKRIRAEVHTLDFVCDREQVAKIDILKMDVQGGEVGILKGARTLLSQHKISMVYTEVLFLPMYKDQPLFGDIFSELTQHGYRFHFFYNHGFSGRSGRLLWADAIFVAPELAARSAALLSQSMNEG